MEILPDRVDTKQLEVNKKPEESAVSILHRFRKMHEGRLASASTRLKIFILLLALDVGLLITQRFFFKILYVSYFAIMGIVSLVTLLIITYLEAQNEKRDIENIDEFYNLYNLQGMKDK